MKKHLSHGYVSLLRSCLVWKSHNAPPPPPSALGQEALHDSSLRCAKKTTALLDCEEQEVNREGS